MEKLKNRVAVITGGTSGIGLATAKELLNEGAVVIITGRYKNTLDETVKTLGSNAYGIVCDSRSMADIGHLKSAVLQYCKGIDILFANAGYGRFAPVEDVSEDMFDELFDMLVKGTFFTVKELLPVMNQGGAVILNTSVVTQYGSANASVYAAAKSAVQSMVKNFASEFVSKGIRVNGVSPGYTETDIFNKTGMTPGQISDVKGYVKTILPFKRFATSSEIAKVVSFLASDDSHYIHGAEIQVDGGYSVIR